MIKISSILEALPGKICKQFFHIIIHKNITSNIIDVANIITDSAILRKESRGLHYNKDYPEIKDEYNNPTELKNKKKDFIMKLVSKV